MTENKPGMGISQPIGDPKVDTHHSYEEFTQRLFYIEINRETVNLAGDFNLVLDIATGTGGIIEELVKKKGDQRRRAGFVGIDIDDTALIEARKKFENLDNGYFVFDFHKGSAEKTGEEDNFFDLVTFCNAIHLTDVPHSLAEAYRVLEPGGTFIANSAFVDGVGYPTPEAEALWRSLGSGSIRKVMRAGYKPERGTDFVTYKVEDYERFAQEAGFTDIKIETIEANMDINDVLAICHYDEFAKGVLRGVPLEVAHKALADTALEIFEKLKEAGKPEVFPRGWMLMKAVKPSFSPTA